jgi:hypothetical protein
MGIDKNDSQLKIIDKIVNQNYSSWTNEKVHTVQEYKKLLKLVMRKNNPL